MIVSFTGNQGSSVQALGLEHQHGEASVYLHQGTVNTQTVISVLDDYRRQIDQTTVIILDNASCHKSTAFLDQVEKWAERGLLVYYLPPYSPELNAIERLWKKLKCQFLPPTAWERFKTLVSTLTSTLTEIGEATYLPSMERYAQ